MPSSLVKFSDRYGAGEQKLFWNRAEQDGLPFRGAYAPSMPEEEYEARVVRVADARNAFFDTLDATQNKLYLDVIECVANGWFRLIHLERFWKGSTQHYVEWLEYYMEDGSRTPFSRNNVMELSGGQQDLPGTIG